MSKRARKFIDLAARVASNSSDTEFQIGAVLIRGKNIISTGWNQGSKTHPMQYRMYPQRPGTGLHAEIHTLQGLRPYDVAGSDLYICRVRSSGDYGLSKPCDRCMVILRDYSVKRIFFSEGPDKIGVCRPK